MSKHIIALSLAGAALAWPAWAGPVTLVTRKLEAFTSFGQPGTTSVEDFQNDVGAGSAPLVVEAFLNRGASVTKGFGVPGFLSATAVAGGNSAVGVDVLALGSVGFNRPAVIYIARAIEVRTVTNTSSSTISLAGDFFVPAPTIQILSYDPTDFDPLAPFGTAVFSLNSKLTRVDGTSVDLLPGFSYGVDTLYAGTDADLAGIVVGSAPSVSTGTGPNGQQTFSVPDLTLTDFPLGSLAPGETLTVTGTYLARASIAVGETGAAVFIGDPNNLSASGARFTLETVDGPGTVVPPGPTPVPAPAGWAVLASALAALAAVRRRG